MKNYKISGSLILIADSSPASRLTLRHFLKSKSYNVCEASSAREAIDVFDRESPKMVLMRIEMPMIDHIDSLDACRRIREIDRDEYSPIMMLAPTEDSELINAAFDAGAADYITDPISWPVLEQRIKYKLKTSRMAYELEASETRFRQLFEDSPLPYEALDVHGRIIDANKAWLEMMATSDQEAIGKSFGDFMPEAEWRKFLHQFPSLIKQGSISNLHLNVMAGDGKMLDVELNGRVAYDSSGNFKQTHSILQNITERKEMESKLQRLARTDPLTGLANRRYFFELADRSRNQCARYHRSYALMMLDIDHFKSVNDTYGHDIGDVVLKATADEMNQLLRDIDILGRLGGEEFAIAMPETTLSSALNIAERIRSSIEQNALQTGQGEVRFTISIGIAELSEANESNEQLLKQADKLLYRAKQNGRNRVEISNN